MEGLILKLFGHHMMYREWRPAEYILILPDWHPQDKCNKAAHLVNEYLIAPTKMICLYNAFGTWLSETKELMEIVDPNLSTVDYLLITNLLWSNNPFWSLVEGRQLLVCYL